MDGELLIFALHYGFRIYGLPDVVEVQFPHLPTLDMLVGAPGSSATSGDPKGYFSKELPTHFIITLALWIPPLLLRNIGRI